MRKKGKSRGGRKKGEILPKTQLAETGGRDVGRRGKENR